MVVRAVSQVALIGVILLCAATLTAEEWFPGNIFELRPPRVRVSEPHETADDPYSVRYFSYFSPPPRAPSQEDIRLTDADSLTFVYPVSNGSFHSGGVERLRRLLADDNEFTLDIFTFPTGAIGWAVVPPLERGILFAELPAGEYTFRLRKWFLTAEERIGFDPDEFVPPPGETSVGVNFTFTVVPEPSTLILACGALVGLGMLRRIRRRS